MKTGMLDRCYWSIFGGSLTKAHPEKTKAEIGELVSKHTTCVDITDIAKWVAEDSNRLAWQQSDFPCIASPWMNTWLEWRNPEATIFQGEVRDAWYTFSGTWGCSIIDWSSKGEFFPGSRQLVASRYTTPWKYHYHWIFYSEKSSESGKARLAAFFEFFLDSNGVPLCHLFHKELSAFATNNNHSCDALLIVVQFALSLMHCKNVSIQENPIPPEVIRRREKRNHFRGVVYKTLNINPIRKQARAESAASTTGETSIQRALHICRGHFREYTEDKPLFGKYKGRYWIPMHTRGDAKVGEVKKDYRMMPPSGEEEDGRGGGNDGDGSGGGGGLDASGNRRGYESG